MRILVALVHYFAGDSEARHASTDASRREDRTRVVAHVVQAYRGLYGPTTTLDIETKSFQTGPGSPDLVDIAVITVPGCSLLDDEFCRRYGVIKLEYQPENPRMLGFHAHELFAQLRSEYDMFVYSEDDLRPGDPDLFAKIAWFNRLHGDRRVLLPNRFEWYLAGPTIKTYVDGDLRAGFVDPLLALVRDEETLHGEAFARPRTFRRARNPHSGFFAISQVQLGYWLRQPHWLDRDCGFVSPLESAATLGLAKTFAIYKPFGGSADFLELQHLDTRFSSLSLARASKGLAGVALPQTAGVQNP